MELASGLYRTSIAHPVEPEAVPADRLVYVGEKDGQRFVVCPHYNEKNRWFWREPVVPLNTDDAWAGSLKQLPAEGFYTLPRTLNFDGGGRWVENAIVQLGYNPAGQGILFVAERRDATDDNALWFSDKGHRIDDDLLSELRWAPILPVSAAPGSTH